MRIRRNFLGENVKYEYEETHIGDINKCGKVVAFRGDVWLWEFYNTGEPPIDYELFYTKVKPKDYHDHVVEVIVGRLLPKEVKCDCGAKAVGSSKHSWYCSIETIDPWKED